jgi:cell division protein FtsQ
MKKKIIITSIISIIIIVGIAVTIMMHGKQHCKEVNIEINYENASHFIKDYEILSIITNVYPEIKSTEISDINLSKISHAILENPFIENVSVSMDLNGNLHVKVKQKKPLVRVFNKKGESFYISHDKKLMPTSPYGTERVVVASGEINTVYSDSLVIKELFSSENNLENMILFKIWKTASHINTNPFLKAQIDQIFITEKLEIELIPRVGDQVIILGDINDLDIKFQNLEVMYQQGFQKVGWDKYSIINLKYLNQVVCTRKQ